MSNQKPPTFTRVRDEIVQILRAAQGKYVSVAELETRLWQGIISPNNVYVHIHLARQEYGQGYIQSARGLGYRWVANPPE